MSAPFSIRNSTTFEFPDFEAMCKAVVLLTSDALIETVLLSTILLTESRSPD